MSSFGTVFFFTGGVTDTGNGGDFSSPGRGLLIGEGRAWGLGEAGLGAGVAGLLVLGSADVGRVNVFSEFWDLGASCNLARRFSLI